MNTQRLARRIKNREAKICIVGLGYVGLPTALLLAKVGYPVSGYDVDRKKVSSLQAHKLPFGKNERDLISLFKQVGRSLTVSDDPTILVNRDVYLIAVATPLLSDKRINAEPLKEALRQVGKVLPRGSLVIVESTSAPGTAEDLVIPLLEQTSGRTIDRGFLLLHCPERVSPGQTLTNLTTYPRVIGASSRQGGVLGKMLYGSFCKGPIDVTDIKTAEVVKTAENADRDIRIALANEFAIICDEHGVNFWKVRELINKMPGKDILQAGSGVGGHCIPKDPWLLIDRLKDKTIARLISASRAVNDDMPRYVFKLLQKSMWGLGDTALAGKKIAVLGYTYREHTDDTRDSPTGSLLKLLEREDIIVAIHDPLVSEYATGITEVTQGAYAVIIMVAHDQYRNLRLSQLKAVMDGKILIDGRGIVERRKAEKAGFLYRGIGSR